ncbi:MAG TPA: T9SS type A sorting domain-containing protein, partial [Rhodothermales bacterium]|nr:T9SS type A sorting domain-containing protein [Rhodothermales bacterium]
RTESVGAVSATEAWVGNREGELRHTTNGGATWAPVASGTTRDLNDMQFFAATTAYVVGNGEVVLKTTDGGTSWADVSGSQVGDDGLFFRDVNTGWVVGDAGSIWFTSTGGTTWALQPSGTSADLHAVHFPTASAGWAVGTGGTIVRFSSGATAAEAGAGAAALALRVAPNPARDAAVVSFTLPAAGRATVGVYDALGRQVALLHDGTLAAGPHTLALDAARLPTGAYVVRATADGALVALRRVTVAH